MAHRFPLVVSLCAGLLNLSPCLIFDQPVLAQEAAAPGDGYRNYDQFTTALRALAAEHRDSVQLTTIGESLQGRNLWALRLALPGEIDADKRPSLLLTANLDGDHLVGGEVALRAARELVRRAGEDDESSAAKLLRQYTLYVVPRVNPDAAELYFADLKQDIVRNRRPDDADRDGRIDEDPPNDLNGDGRITMMRIYDPEKANRMADPDDPRLDIAPDAEKGQRAEFYLMIEGLDDDGDGQYNEDDIGGVDLNRNFMHGFQEHDDGVGRYPLSEPESLALLEYALSHQNIAIALTYGRHDNLNNTPSGQGTLSGGAPINIDGADVPIYRAVGESFKKITGLANVTSPAADGAFHAWAYAQYGIPSFATPVWSRPSEAAPAGGEGGNGGEPRGGGPEGGGGAAPGGGPEDFSDILTAAQARGMEVTREQLEAMPPDRIAFFRQMIASGAARPPGGGEGGGGEALGGGRGGFRRGGGAPGGEAQPMGGEPGGGAQPPPGGPGGGRFQRGAPRGGEQPAPGGRAGSRNNREGDKAWLDYSTDKRNGEGFVEWTDFEHPQLGKVQIGGFTPYFRTNPPAEELDALAGKQADFILDLLDKMPKVSLTAPTVTRLASGLYEIKAALVNDGFLPAGTRMAVRNRRARPFVVRLDAPVENVLSGQAVSKIWSVAGSGGRNDFRWIVRAADGSNLTITLFSDKYGESSTTVMLSAGGN